MVQSAARRWIVVFAASCLATMPAHASAETLDYDLGVELPLTLGAGGLWLGLYLADLPATPSPVHGRPEGIDAMSPFRQVDGPVLVSDVLLYGTLAGTAAATTVFAGKGSRATAFGVWAEVFVINGTMTDITKRAVDRPRPYVYGGMRTGEADDYQSFYSGHTSFVASSAFATARTLDVLRAPTTPVRVALYAGAGALTVAAGTSRVLAGKHFVSDVLVGGVIGASTGWLIPELHRNTELQVRLGAGSQRVSLSVSSPL